MAADQGHHVLQYYINIMANTQQLLDMEDFLELQQIEQQACKKLTQVEVGYGLLNVT